MDRTTPEASNQKLVDEGMDFLVECNGEATAVGFWGKVYVELTYEGGNIALLAKQKLETVKPTK